MQALVMPGLGVESNETEAKKYPCENTTTTWTQTRLVDGALQTPGAVLSRYPWMREPLINATKTAKVAGKINA